jgi:hypothetical protein
MQWSKGKHWLARGGRLKSENEFQIGNLKFQGRVNGKKWSVPRLRRWAVIGHCTARSTEAAVAIIEASGRKNTD